MPRTCEWCREAITFDDAQTTTGGVAWHTRCWNEAAALRAEYAAEREDCEGFPYRPLPELCAECHTRGPEAYHRIGKRSFEKRRGISFARITAGLTMEWEEGRVA